MTVDTRHRSTRHCHSRWPAALLLVVGLAWLASPIAHAQDRSGVRPEVLSLPSGPGSVEGLGETFEPSLSTGSSSYSVAIQVPPGAGGFAPSLSLRYSSGAGNGELGLGWSLGTPAVQVSTEDGLARYDATDTYALRGLGGRGAEDLVQLADGSYRFRTEGAFVRGRQRSDGSWSFRDRSGGTWNFGEAPTARTADGARVAAWHLSSREDTFGHAVSYVYEVDGGKPYLVSVSYNEADASYANVVRFVYTARSDALTSYMSGFPVTTSRVLTRIEVRHGAAIVRSYDLAYDASSGSSRLASVVQTGTDGATAIPPLAMQYADLDARAMSIVDVPSAPARALGPTAEIDDVDGDGLPDVLVTDPTLDGGRYSWYPNVDGRSFGARQTLTSSPSVWLTNGTAQLADMNGDAIADVVARVSASSDGMRFYPGSTGGFGAAVVIAPAPAGAVEGADTRLVDLDHDGRADWIRIEPTSGAVSIAFNLGLGAFSATEARPAVDATEIVSFARGAVFADFNGDGLSDIALARTGTVRYWPGIGRGSFGAAQLVAGAPTLADTELGELQIRDVTGDGLADLTHVGVRQLRVWQNLSGAALAPPLTIDGTPERRTTTLVRLADVNGNGSSDIVWIDPTSSTPWRYLDLLSAGTPGLLIRIDNGMGKVTSLSYAGVGAMRAWARESGTSWTRRSPLGQMLLAGIVTDDSLGNVVTTRLAYADGYFDAEEREFRGFATAFRFDDGDAEQPTLVTGERYDLGDVDEALKGMLLSRSRADADGAVFDAVSSTYEVLTVATAADGTQLRYAFARREETETRERTGAPVLTRVERESDSYGNVFREASYGRVDGADTSAGDDESIVVRTFAIDESRWIVDRVATERTENLAGERLAETRTYYDGEAFVGMALGAVERGAVSRVESWIERERFIDVARHARDSHGNEIAFLDGRGLRRERDYDAETGTFVVAERVFPSPDAELEWSAEHDRAMGVVTRVVEPNGTESRATYDALGRLETLVEPGDSDALPTQSIRYTFGAPTSSVRVELRSESGTERTEVSIRHVDGLGRDRATYVRLPDARWVASGLATYGARGLTAFSAQPSFVSSADFAPPLAAAPGERTRYDALGRTLETAHPDGSIARMFYEPFVEIAHDENDTDATSAHVDTPTRSERDGRGRLVAVVERDGVREITTRYTYDALGNLRTAVDALGRTRTYTYDGRSRRVAIADPNAGAWRLAYDDADALVSREDPTGRKLRIEYDEAGRPTAEWHTLPGMAERVSLRLHYDAPAAEHSDFGFMRGRLGWVEDDAGAVFFGYDERGRQTDVLRRFADGSEHMMWSEFDAQGRAVRRGFPDGSHLQMQYDARGMLASIGGILERATWNAHGGLEEAVFANGVTDVRSYDDRLRVRRMTATTSAGIAARDLEYGYDATSRVTRRIDHRTAMDATRDRDARYELDDRYRLTDAFDGAAHTHWAYDDLANIVSVASDHTDPWLNATFHYGEDGATPDQLTTAQIGGTRDERFTYDAAGRVERDGERSYEYDAKGRLSAVVRGGTVEEYVYGADDKRVEKRVTSDGVTRVTRYLARDVELREGKLIRYVFFGDERAVRLDATDDAIVTHGRAEMAASVVPGRVPPWAPPVTLLALLGALAVMLQSRSRRASGRAVPRASSTWAVASISVAWLVLASCGKDEPVPHDISMPIDDFPASAELYLHDLQGTPVARVDAAGSVVADAATHPYGAVRYESGGVDPYGFVGNERDFGAGISDFQARPYRPELSRFLGVDPVPLLEPEAFSEGFRWQAYTYAAGDPVNGVDRDGEWVIAFGYTVGGVFLVGGQGSGGVYLEGGREWSVGLTGSAQVAVGGAPAPEVGFGGFRAFNAGQREDFEGPYVGASLTGSAAGAQLGGSYDRPIGGVFDSTRPGTWTISGGMGVGVAGEVHAGRTWALPLLDTRSPTVAPPRKAPKSRVPAPPAAPSAAPRESHGGSNRSGAPSNGGDPVPLELVNPSSVSTCTTPLVEC